VPDDAPLADQPVNTLASVGRRIAARLLDGVVLLPVWMVLLLAFGVDSSDGVLDVPRSAFNLFWLVAVAYEIGLIALRGQTVGKRWLGIKVVDATTGAVPDLDQSARRSAPTLIQIIPVLGAFAPVLYLPLLWRPRRQGLHDRLAATVVVRV
jgi:uncharacterized RDD family membrane protein YckC